MDSTLTLESAYDDDLLITAHRPYARPAGLWRLRQRWLDLLFAHWPIEPAQLDGKLPPGLEADLFEGQAWLGVVPFRMDQVRSRIAGQASFSVPTTERFLELNLRTYVRSRRTGRTGVYFFALDCSSWLSVLGARTLFHLPYFPAAMAMTVGDEGFDYQSQRKLSRGSVRFDASYGPIAGDLNKGVTEPLVRFLTERYCLFTASRGRLLVGEIHHRPWPLEPAQATFRADDLPRAHGFSLPDVPPLLHYSRELRVSLWGLREEERG